MLAKVRSCAVVGLEGAIVEVEADISSGLPSFSIVGLPRILYMRRIFTASKPLNWSLRILSGTISLVWETEIPCTGVMIMPEGPGEAASLPHQHLLILSGYPGQRIERKYPYHGIFQRILPETGVSYLASSAREIESGALISGLALKKENRESRGRTVC